MNILRRLGPCRTVSSILHAGPSTAVRLPRYHPRLYSTQFIPVQQLLQTKRGEPVPTEGADGERLDDDPFEEYLRDPVTSVEEAMAADEGQPTRRPKSPAFYTARAPYYDTIVSLRSAIGQARATLKTLNLLPLPDFAREALLPIVPFWKGIEEMSQEVGIKLNTTRYRRLCLVLNELNECLRIASTAGSTELADMLEKIVAMFERGDSAKQQFLSRGQHKVAPLDAFGRSYTMGRRKTSSARVWMIPTSKGTPLAPLPPAEDHEEEVEYPPENTPVQEPVSDFEAAQAAPKGKWDLELPLEEEASVVASPKDTPDLLPVKPIDVPITTILVNNLPLSQYFPNLSDRERVVYPLKVARVMGRFNIFTIARGGGTTGQTGAIAHAIAKGLIAHDENLYKALHKANLIKRDPRMVERKKTGLAKARKRYTWVKR
ncbi:ribosomal protein S9/S16-domain-containing protein [Mucidula mucida]|nr:ribosomal protein S9/S16-domain-containing protein [Mucidula mucida]